MRTRNGRLAVIALGALLALQACASGPGPGTASAPAARPDLAALWARNAAEYEALALQVYAAATEDLQRLIEDTSWSALPDQAADAPANEKPAIIFDVDETVLNNARFQLEHEPPFSDAKFNAWHAANKAPAVPGAAEFVRRARAAGVELFFVTNRPCETTADSADPCPQERVTLEDLQDAGMPTDAEHVMLAHEKPEWTSEKKGRRDLIAKNHRVIMLFGDDLGDFLACSRARPSPPCTQAATQASRKAAIEKHAAYWGEGWYVLPNPMYGSWTTVR